MVNAAASELKHANRTGDPVADFSPNHQPMS